MNGGAVLEKNAYFDIHVINLQFIEIELKGIKNEFLNETDGPKL